MVNVDNFADIVGYLLRTVPPFVTAHTLCASHDTQVS